MATSYQVLSSSKYNSMPTSLLVGIGISWHMWHRGVTNAYSSVTSDQVPSSLKYYSMPTSLLAGIGISWHMWGRRVTNAYSTVYFMKCQIVRNISQW